MTNSRPDFGRTIRRYRMAAGLTLRELGAQAGISPSHLGRIEKGERFPSAHTLQRLARPLGLTENRLFSVAGYLSADHATAPDSPAGWRLDPVVARMMAEETVEVQRAVFAVLSLLKSLAKSLAEGNL